jgi:hypothetical protein
LNFTLHSERYNIFVGALYQKPTTQVQRELLSDIPLFLMFGVTLPLGKHTQLHCDSSFYSTRSVFPLWHKVRPLSHRIRLDYDGHCWGVSLGFEEKRYRQYGNWKSEHAFSMSLRLDSLGSFTKRFKRPVVLRAPDSYEV